MQALLWVFLGGGLGSMFRYLTSFYTQKFWNFHQFPLGTLIINVLGCFAIGCLSVIFKENHNFKYLLITGFCGGFTTFSTFSLEIMQLFQSQNYILAIIYLSLSIILGLLAVYLGLFITKI